LEVGIIDFLEQCFPFSILVFIHYLVFSRFFGELIFAIKTILVAFLFILVRAMLPRYRFDQLMQIG